MAEPITVAEFAEHLRIDAETQTAEAATLAIYLAAARRKVEEYTGAYVEQRQAEFVSNCTPRGSELSLPLAPRGENGQRVAVSNVTVTYEDSAEAAQTFAAENFAVRSNRLALNSGRQWPTISGRPDSFKVAYTTGFADGEVPENLRSAILLEATALYEQRSAQTNAMQFVNPAVQALAQPHRVDLGI